VLLIHDINELSDQLTVTWNSRLLTRQLLISASSF